MKLMKPEEVNMAGDLKIGWYGRNGAGKTTLVSTIPETEPTMYVTTGTEPGIKVITKTGKKNFRVVVAEQFKDLGEIFDYLRRGLEDKRVASGEKKFYRNLVFDTWTRVQALAQAQVTGQEVLSPEDMLKYITNPPKLPRGYDAWQAIGALSSQWMRNFNSLPMNVVYLFQEMTSHPKFENDILETGPALTPSAVITARETLELLGRIYIANEEDMGDGLEETASDARKINLGAKRERRMLVGATDRYFAKGPEDLLGFVLRKPTWEKISGSMLSGTPVDDNNNNEKEIN